MDSQERGLVVTDVSNFFTAGKPIPYLPSARFPGFGLDEAYRVDKEYWHRRFVSGRKVVGRKLGFCSYAQQRMFGIGRLVWSYVYDDTIELGGVQTPGLVSHKLALGSWPAAQLEPEIVFCVNETLESGGNAWKIMGSVEWVALGFEIIESPYPKDSKITPADFVAAAGLHRKLVVGAPVKVYASDIGDWMNVFRSFQVKLFKDGAEVVSNSIRKFLRSPVEYLAQAADLATKQPYGRVLTVGEVISTGSLTTPQPVLSGEVWRFELPDMPLPSLEIATC